MKTAEFARKEWRMGEAEETLEAFANTTGMEVAEVNVLATHEVA